MFLYQKKFFTGKKGFFSESYRYPHPQKRVKTLFTSLLPLLVCCFCLLPVKPAAAEKKSPPSVHSPPQHTSVKKIPAELKGASLKENEKKLSKKIQFSRAVPSRAGIQKTKSSKIQLNKPGQVIQLNKTGVKRAVQNKPKISSFERKIKGKKISFIDMFNTELFSRDMEKASEDSMAKLYSRRSKIIGTEKTRFSAWWKLSMDINLTFSKIMGTPNLHYGITPIAAFKAIAQMHPSIFAEAEFELFNRIGISRSVFEERRPDGINQLEFIIEWDPQDESWLNPLKMNFGNVNQENLGSIDHTIEFPLLFSDDIAFPAIVSEVDISQILFPPNSQHKLSASLQGALPTNTADDKIPQTTFENLPALVTGSLFYDLGTQLFNKQLPINFHLGSTWFYFGGKIPGDVAERSRERGTFLEAERTLGNFGGLYSNINVHVPLLPYLPSNQKLALNLGFQHVWNIMEKQRENQCYIVSLSLPFDYSDNNRFTVTAERFEKESNCSIAFYSSTRYANHDMQGWVGEFNWDMYSRNLTLGFRYSYATSYRQRKDKYNSFLAYARTNYAKIY